MEQPKIVKVSLINVRESCGQKVPGFPFVKNIGHRRLYQPNHAHRVPPDEISDQPFPCPVIPIVGIRITVPLVPDSPNQVRQCRSALGNQVINHRFGGVRELVSSTFHLDAQAGLAVSDPDSCRILGIEPTTFEEGMPPDSLMAAEYKIIIRNNQLLGRAQVGEAEVKVDKVAFHPVRGRHIKLPNDLAGGGANLRIQVENLHQLFQKVLIRLHVVIGEIENLALRHQSRTVPGVMNALTPFHEGSNTQVSPAVFLEQAFRPIGRSVICNDDLKTVGGVVLG